MKKASLVRKAVIDITGECQNRCVFCYNAVRKGSMDLKRFKKIVGAYHSLDFVGIGGGEPLLNPELPKMLGFLLSKNIHTDVSTNAILYPSFIIRYARECPELFNIQVNVPAIDEATYDSVTRTHGNLPIVKKNIERMLESGITPRLVLVLCMENFSQIKPIVSYADGRELQLYINLMVPLGHIKAHPITGAEAVGVSRFIYQQRLLNKKIEAGWEGSSTFCQSVAQAYGLELKENGCTALRGERIYINADGSKKRCEFLEHS